MSQKWYLLSPPSLYYSGFETEEFDMMAEDGFSDLLNSFAARNAILYASKIENGVSTRAIFQNVTSDSVNTSNIRQILLRKGAASGVQYILDSDRKEYWLVNSLPSSNGIYDKVIAWYCQSVLRFISPLTNLIVSYPVHSINSTQYNSGETNKQQMTLGSSQHLIYIPYNKETILMDHGCRLLLDRNPENPTAYRLTQVDSTSYAFKEGGLLQWTVVEDQFSPDRDDKQEMVADRYASSPIFSSPVAGEGGWL